MHCCEYARFKQVFRKYFSSFCAQIVDVTHGSRRLPIWNGLGDRTVSHDEDGE